MDLNYLTSGKPGLSFVVVRKQAAPTGKATTAKKRRSLVKDSPTEQQQSSKTKKVKAKKSSSKVEVVESVTSAPVREPKLQKKEHRVHVAPHLAITKTGIKMKSYAYFVPADPEQKLRGNGLLSNCPERAANKAFTQYRKLFTKVQAESSDKRAVTQAKAIVSELDSKGTLVIVLDLSRLHARKKQLREKAKDITLNQMIEKSKLYPFIAAYHVTRKEKGQKDKVTLVDSNGKLRNHEPKFKPQGEKVRPATLKSESYKPFVQKMTSELLTHQKSLLKILSKKKEETEKSEQKKAKKAASKGKQ